MIIIPKNKLKHFVFSLKTKADQYTGLKYQQQHLSPDFSSTNGKIRHSIAESDIYYGKFYKAHLNGFAYGVLIVRNKNY